MRSSRCASTPAGSPARCPRSSRMAPRWSSRPTPPPRSRRSSEPMSALVRGGLVVIGVLLMLGGLLLIAGVADGLAIPGLQLVAMGAFLVVAVAIERQRYRSAAAEGSNQPAGPGGGEPAGALEA